MTQRASELGRLYDTLARYQWWCARWQRVWRRDRREQGLTLRKRLLPQDGGPTDGGLGLDRWLQQRIGFDRLVGARVLDLGCGFGASLRHWLAAGAGAGVGVTASRYQARRAAACQSGAPDRNARFVVQDFTAPVVGSFDVVLAIEALGHAEDLPRALANVHRALAPGGLFVWVEDLLRRDLSDDLDVLELAQRWSSPPLRTLAAARQALHETGLRVEQEVDLTASVPLAAATTREQRAARLRRWRGLPLPALRRLLDAFLGGLGLERLYARGEACYVVFLCHRPHPRS